MQPLPLTDSPLPLDPKAILALLSGAAGLFFLMPRPKRFPLPLGIALAALGLLLALLATWDPSSVESILFYGFSGLALLGGLLLITQANPARAALSFVLVVLATSGLFLLNGAPFVMAGTIIIYAGAIVVTLLFVIMLAQPDGISNADARSREPFLACLTGLLLLTTLLVVIGRTFSVPGFDAWLDRVHVARQQTSAEEIRKTLGEGFASPADNLIDIVPSERRNAILPFEEAFRNALAGWKSDDLAGWHKRLDELESAGRAARQSVGRFQPPFSTPLSPFAGTPSNRLTQSLPADNVGGLGRTLFSDYLLAVELGGTILLIATIGAIAIATRPATRGAA